MNTWDRIDKALFGHDIFISYSRLDGLDYSYKLSEYFISKGYDCFIDQLMSFTPGSKLPPTISRAIKRSTSLVVVGSAGAGGSVSIEKEIVGFLSAKNNNPLTIISIDKSAFSADWYPIVKGLPLIEENANDFKTHSPSENILSRITNSLNFTKKSRRLRIIGLSVLTITILLTCFSFVQLKKASSLNNKITQLNSDITQLNTDKIKQQYTLDTTVTSLTSTKTLLTETTSKVVNAQVKNATLENKNLLLNEKTKTLSKNIDLAKLELGQKKQELQLAKKEFDAVQIATEAMGAAQTNPTMAVKLALKSYGIRKNNYASNLLTTLFNSNNFFYKKQLPKTEKLSFSKDGRILGLTLPEKQLILSDTSGESFKIIKDTYWSGQAFFVNNDSLIFRISNETASLYDLDGNTLKHFFGKYNTWLDVCYIKEKELVFCYGYQQLYIIDVLKQTIHTIPLNKNEYPPDADFLKIVYSKYDDQLILAYETGAIYRFTTEGELIKKNILPLEVNRMIEKVLLRNIMPVCDGKYMLLFNNYKPCLIRTADNFVITFAKDSSRLMAYDLIVSETGKYFAVSYASIVDIYKIDTTVLDGLYHYYKMWDIELEKSGIQKISFSPEDDYIIAAANTGEAFLYTIDGEQMGVGKVHRPDYLNESINEIYWSKNSSEVITTGYNDSTCFFWDFNSIRKRVLHKGRFDYDAIYAVSKDYQYLAYFTLADGSYRLFIRSFDGELTDTINTGCGVSDISHCYLDFSDDGLFLRIILKSNSWQDTMYFNTEYGYLMEDKNKVSFLPINYKDDQKWSVRWSSNSFGRGSFYLKNKLGNELIMQPESKQVYKTPEVGATCQGTVFCSGDSGFEVIFLDSDNIVRILKQYKEFNTED